MRYFTIMSFEWFAIIYIYTYCYEVEEEEVEDRTLV